MSEHDPLCPKYISEFHNYCECALIRQAEQRGREREFDRVMAEIDAVKAKVAFGSKAGYRQGFVGCWHLIRETVARGRLG